MIPLFYTLKSLIQLRPVCLDADDNNPGRWRYKQEAEIQAADVEVVT